MSTDDLIAQTRSTATAVAAATRWVDHPGNAASVGRDKDSVVRALRFAQTRVTRLQMAVGRPMCVGVFGPSQAGKSYLVEVLARPQDGALRARFDGMEPVDFLSEINPIGEKESTGLVTRFTAASTPGTTPDGFPIRLNLLSELEIVKILGNTFFLDGDQTKEKRLTADEFAQVLAEVSRAAGKPEGGVSEDDLYDLQDYFEKSLAGSRSLDGLGAYWEELRTLAPRLPLAERAQLFSFLWGRHTPFTALFLELGRALLALNGARELFAPRGALMPREGSILDVATLAGLSRPGGESLEVCTGEGLKAALPRPVLAALTAELRIEVADPPRPFFAHTDLLDFPGARSRQKVNLAAFFEANPDAIKETFLRGKVAYLFERYVAEQELTSMLLCVRPSNQEVTTLPDLVNDWIEATHGRTPLSRKAQPTVLFFVMTWFDSHFVDKAGDVGNAGARFSARIEASLLSFFGKAHAWPRNWTPGAAFQNCYWFRNPNYPAESIIRYNGRAETAFLPEKAARIQELRSGFLALPEASDHFRDPARAFDEALRLNDGGISYLAENLAQVCNPSLKTGQIRDRLMDLNQHVAALMSKYYVDLDITERLATRRAAADRVFDDLERVVAHNKFGSFLGAFLLDPTELSDVVYSTLRGGKDTREAPEGREGPAAPAPRTQRPGMLRPQLAASPQPATREASAAGAAGGAVVRERERMLASACIDAWVRKLSRMADDAELHRRFGVDESSIRDLVQEKLTLLKRLDLETAIARELQNYLTVEAAESSSPKVALIASTHINRLVGDLGFGKLPPPERPEVNSASANRRAFDERPVVNDASGLGPTPHDFAAQYATDWFFGYLRVVEDNVLSMHDLKIDPDLNAQLKAILEQLGARTLASAEA